MKMRALFLPLAIFFSTSAFSQNWYIDGGAGLITFKDSEDSISPKNIYVRGGYQFNDYINIGLESSATIIPDELPELEGVDWGVNVLSFYIRAGYPVNDKLFVYAQTGTSSTELSATEDGIEYTADDDDTMTALGFEVTINSERKRYISVNYSKYNDNDGIEATAINAGLGARF